MALNVLTFLFAVIVLIRAIKFTNHMDGHTCHALRVSVLMLAVTALAVALTALPVYANDADMAKTMFVLSVAFHLWADRRHDREAGALHQ